ncbi:LacI family DNA-binding transcriptional regulator [Arthrobacter sunyaminii]|uniref:LacI family transcriptional regulator n=1 Tax=Arthrobacter sunyaminii TaxID=2816859 RepID=A0A975PD53_9MICC|nr:LacI family DNA-binding transcriptional regulator [Arthrobacter sunyaminii]MBO0908948.1 LacI family DNA-binding transcriptional regulator [Arthrobacter sunyaminii]QWQ35550.1 LacI family transcriptional regulator [Arthrobacter sunyaminii]
MSETRARRPGRAVTTLADVAAAAGVSTATVSRVMNRVPTVNADLALRVEAIARQMGYQFNAAARTLATGRTGAVALIISEADLSQPYSFTSAPLHGVLSAVARHDLQIVMLLSGSAQQESYLLEYLRRTGVDGAMVILEDEISHLPELLRDAGVPVVYLGRPLGDAKAQSYVDVDNVGGARLATEALIEAGRSRIAILAGNDRLTAARDRLEGWRSTMAEHGLEAHRMARGAFSPAGGSETMTRLLAAYPDIDGVFVCSDYMGSGALQVLAAAGRRVPHDISVVSYDDSVLAEVANPPLTSVSQPLERMGEEMVDALAALMASSGTSVVQRVLPSSLTRRDSL